MSGLWPIVLRSLRARPLRTALTIIAVALGVAAVLGTQLTLGALDDQAQRAEAARAGDSSLDLRTTSGPGIERTEITRLRAIAGVIEAEPLLEKRVAARRASSAGAAAVVVTVVGLDTKGRVALRPVHLIDGRLPRPGRRDEVAIDQALAGALPPTGGSPIGLGDHILLTTATGPDRFTVVGFTAGTEAGAALARSAVFAGPAAIEGPFGLGLHTPLVAVRVGGAVSVAAVAQSAREQLGASVSAYPTRGNGAEPLHDLRPLLILMVTLTVAVGAGVTGNSVALGIVERRRETGLLRAAGASATQVFKLFVAEAALAAVAGAAAGILAGLVLAAGLVGAYAPADLGAPGLRPTAANILLAITAGILAALVGAGVAAYPVRRITPLVALRAGGAGDVERRPVALLVAGVVVSAIGAVLLVTTAPWVVAAGAVLALGGLAMLLPALAPPVAGAIAAALGVVFTEAPAAVAGLRRRRKRTAMTVAGLTVSVAVAMAAAALSAGASASADRWVSRLLPGDAVIKTPVTQVAAADELSGQVAGLAGVRSVGRLRLFAEPAGGRVIGLAAVDPSFYMGTGGLDMVEGDRNTVLPGLDQGRSVLLPAALGSSTGWHIGSRLATLGADGAPAQLTVTGVIQHSFPAGDGTESLIIGRTTAAQVYGDAARGFDDLLVVTDGNRLASLQGDAVQHGWQAVAISDVRDATRRALEHSIGLLVAVAALAVVVAMLAVVNTLLVNLRQEARTIGLLRAVGMDRRRAVGLVLLEAGVLAATGTIIGIGAGSLLALPLLRSAGSPGFAPAYRYPLPVAAICLVTIVGAALVAVVGPARRAARRSIVSAVRYE